MPPPPYMTHLFPGVPVHDVKFCPFEDVLGVGHGKGFTSLLVPGAGEPNFDSLEADPYEGKRRRREREVNALLDKIPFDLITLDTDILGKLDKTVVAKAKAGEVEDLTSMGKKKEAFGRKSRLERLTESGKAVTEEDESSDDEEDMDDARREEKRKYKMEKADAKKRGRGRNSTLKNALRKKRRNVIDPQTVRLPFLFVVVFLFGDSRLRLELAGGAEGETCESKGCYEASKTECCSVKVSGFWNCQCFGSVRVQVVPINANQLSSIL